MSKLDELVKILAGLEYAGRSNASLASEVGCDEGLVRRARKEVHVAWLESEIDRLNAELEGTRAELARYRRVTLPPKRDRPGRESTRPLFESCLDGLSVPRTAIPGE